MKTILLFVLFVCMVNSASALNQFDENIQLGEIYMPTISAGENGILGIELENTADTSLKNITIAMNTYAYDARSKNTKVPINPTGSPQYFIPYLLKGSKETTYLEIAVQPDAKPGIYPVGFDIVYYIGDSSKMISKIIGVQIGEAERPIPDIQNIAWEPEVPVPGQIINLTFDVVNMKNVSSKNVLLVLNYEEPKSSGGFLDMGSSGGTPGKPIIALGSSTLFLGDINPDEKKPARFILALSNKLETGPYNIKIGLSYETQNGISKTILRDVGIYVNGNPRLDVNILETTPHSPYTTSRIKIINAGTGEARSLKIKVLENEYFSPGKTTFVSSLLGRDDVIDTQIDFYSKNMRTGTYPLLLELMYLGQDGEEIKERVTANVYLENPTSFGGVFLALIIFGIPGYFISRKYRFTSKGKSWIKRVLSRVTGTNLNTKN